MVETVPEPHQVLRPASARSATVGFTDFANEAVTVPPMSKQLPFGQLSLRKSATLPGSAQP